MTLSDDEQRQRRERLRRHWQESIPFNRLCGVTVVRWDPDGVDLAMAFDDRLSSHRDVLHGGALATLIDTAGSAAVMAGHDFNHGSRLATVSMAVQYLSVAPGEDVVAEARCTRRGRQIHHAEVAVRSLGGKQLAQGLVTVNIAGERSNPPREN